MRPGDFAIDAGANIGYHALHIAQLAGSGGLVAAFEPLPYLGDALEASVAENSFTERMTVHRTALDERAGLIAEHSDFLENLLYPERVLQSRELSFLPFLAQWGPAGLEELKNLSASSNLREHRIARITQ